MTDPDAVQMADDERDEFLGRSGTGVLSLSTAAGDRVTGRRRRDGSARR